MAEKNRIQNPGNQFQLLPASWSLFLLHFSVSNESFMSTRATSPIKRTTFGTETSLVIVIAANQSEWLNISMCVFVFIFGIKLTGQQLALVLWSFNLWAGCYLVPHSAFFGAASFNVNVNCTYSRNIFRLAVNSVKLIPLHSYQEKLAVMMRSRARCADIISLATVAHILCVHFWCCSYILFSFVWYT